MKKRWFLLILLLFIIGCSTQQSLLEGIVLFQETLPEPVSVSFTNDAGETATTTAYPGFINLYAKINTDEKIVQSAVTAAQGTIVSAIPKVGIYMIKVEPGKESAFITAMRQPSWVMEIYPLVQLTAYNVHMFDYFSASGFNPASSCIRDHSHGQLVSIVADRNSPDQTVYEMDSYPASTDYIAKIMQVMETPDTKDTPKVFSFSFGSAAEDSVTDEEIRIGCRTINCQTARDAEKNFLRSFYHLMEAEIEFNPAAADKAMFVFAMGNRGLDVDIEIKELQAAYPRAANRIKLVGSSTPDGEITHHRNFASDPNNNKVVYAQGEEKHITIPGEGEIICTGTSFSTPEISGILDYIWSQNPKLTSEQVMKAFDQALAEYKTRVVPHDRNGKTDQSFIDRVIEIATGKGKETKEPSEKEKGAVTEMGKNPPRIDMPSKLPDAPIFKEYNVPLVISGGEPPYLYGYRWNGKQAQTIEVGEGGLIRGRPREEEMGDYSLNVCVYGNNQAYSCSDLSVSVVKEEETWTGTFHTSRTACYDFDSDTSQGRFEGTFTATITIPARLADLISNPSDFSTESIFSYDKKYYQFIWSGSESVADQCRDVTKYDNYHYQAIGKSVSYNEARISIWYGEPNGMIGLSSDWKFPLLPGVYDRYRRDISESTPSGSIDSIILIPTSINDAEIKGIIKYSPDSVEIGTFTLTKVV